MTGDGAAGTRGRAAGRLTREQRLAAAFVALADTLADHNNVHSVPTVLTERCVDLLDVSAAAVVLADRGGRMDVAAASSEAARLLSLSELQSDDGPYLDCYRSGQPVHVDADRDTDRWRRFASQARASGFRVAHALPLRYRRTAVGVLVLFSTGSGVQLAAQAGLAQALADVATTALLRERALRRAEDLAAQLQTALDTRVVLEQAKGVIAERDGLSMDDAFAVLRGAARRRQRRLSDLAREVVTGVVDVADGDERRGRRVSRPDEAPAHRDPTASRGGQAQSG